MISIKRFLEERLKSPAPEHDVTEALTQMVGLLLEGMTTHIVQWEGNGFQVLPPQPECACAPNGGASICHLWIGKVHDASELAAAMDDAARYDRKIVIEQGVGGAKSKAREIECSVLGNDHPIASIPGEIVPIKEFYDYNAKYVDEGSEAIIPAKLPKSKQKEVQRLAIAAFQAVDCAGLARVDFLMDPHTAKIYVNEINTIPGFTSISMYPKLWAATGIPYSHLIDQLIQLGLERHADKKQNQYSR